MAHEFVFTMQDLRKVVPPDRVILDDITLAFLPGAKIGVLGANGAGKSSLLRIMAGVDKEFLGEARPADGLRVGFLPQEPQLDPGKDVLGNVEEGVAPRRAPCCAASRRSRRASPSRSTTTRWRSCSRSRRGSRTRSTPRTPGSSTARSRSRWTRCACPPGDADVTTLSGGERRRVALCRLLLSKPDLLLLDEPTNHLDAESVAWLERFLQEYPGTVVAVTHDRYFLDNVAGWILELDRGRGIPWEGNYSLVARAEADSASRSRRSRPRRASARWSASSSGSACRRARARPRARRASRLRGAAAPRRSSACREAVEIAIPPGPRLGDVVVEAEGPAQGLRRPPADRRPRVLAAARRHRRRDRPERRRQDDAVPHDHRRGEAGRRRAAPRRDREARLRRPDRATRSTRRRPSARRSPAARTG